MKKITAVFSVLVAMFAIVFYAYGGAIVAPTFGSYHWELLDSATNVYSTDSVLGVDTQTLFSKKPYVPGYRYAVCIRDSVGAADTITLQAFTYFSNATGTYTSLGAFTFDTLEPVAAVGSNYRRAAMIPAGSTTPCSHFSVSAVGWIAAKVAKIRKAYLFAGKQVIGTYEVDAPPKALKK